MNEMRSMLPEPVKNWIREQGFGEVTSGRGVGGGCINNGARLMTSSGKSFFLKTNAQAPADMFEREAEGLNELRLSPAPRIPQPLLAGRSFFLLEDMAPAARQSDYWSEFGRQLAALHSITKEQFGFYHDNYIGATAQENSWTEDGYTFYAERRLGYQARKARRDGWLNEAQMDQIELLGKRLPELVPYQPASLLHGDLWSGNAITDERGRPAIIDPAAYYGWAEAELAMTALFGPFPDEFYRAYEEARPLEKGYWGRFSIYNLYHLLNHLNLFGEGYLGQVVSILKRWGK